MQYEWVALADVQVGERRRPINEEAVQGLMRSIAEIGLRTPISVRFLDEAERPDGTVAKAEPLLVTGHHRLEAMRRLGRAGTLAAIVDGDETDARLWEIAENLHRAELTALERDEHIAEWIKLFGAKGEKPAQVAQVCGGRGNKGGISAASRELGIDRDDARRALKTSSLSDEAKEAARETGLDNNRSALLRAAAKPAETQAAAIREIAERPRAVKPAASTPEPAPEADAKDSMKALDPEVFEGADDQQDATAPAARLSSAELVEAIKATAPQVAALVPDLLARARAANAVWRENYANLPDPEELGISKAEWKRQTAARKKACEKAAAEEKGCLAKAIAELCRPVAAALLDISPYLNLDEEFSWALNDIVHPDRAEEDQEIVEDEGADGC